MAKQGYRLTLGRVIASPTDGQQVCLWFSSNTSVAQARKGIPIAGTVKKVRFSLRMGGVLGSSETSTVVINKNGSSVGTLTTTVVNDAEHYTVVVDTNIAVSVGDYISIQRTCPTWVTNPTNVLPICSVRIEF